MPQLSPHNWLLETVFYLYATKEDAEKGISSGGTGFLTIVQSETDPSRGYSYGVTNWHVAVNGGCSVVRINCIDGPPEIFEFGPEDWLFLPNYHDVAAINLKLRQGIKHRARYIPPKWFMTEEKRKEEEIGVADDVFMIGRFIDFDGIETNTPSLRFGNISIDAAPIKQLNGFQGDSIVIDMHSRTGFSGSPVFVYRTTGSFFDQAEDDLSKNVVRFGYTLLLLGIHWGQFPERWEIATEKNDKQAASQASLITDGKYVKGLSGMTCVIPAEAIRKVLNMPKLIAQRQASDAIFAKQMPQTPPVIPEMTPSADSDNPLH